MPRRNRVTPFGDLVAVPDRGDLMGNRGVLHDRDGRIGCRLWASRRWICCLTDFRGRHRPILQPGRYTELFFLDEATALAAGHRPCAECRRAAFEHFMGAWASAVDGAEVGGFGRRPLADPVDRRLHAERIEAYTGRKMTYTACAASLPDGTMVALADRPDQAWLVMEGTLRMWTHGGYTEARTMPGGDVVVLTPRSTVAVLAAGYRPHTALRRKSDRRPHTGGIGDPAEPA